MTDAQLIDLLVSFVLPAAALISLLLAVRWVALRLLYRFAPAWAVGPNGLLIDTRGKLGLLQMQDGDVMHHQSRTDHHVGGGGGC